MLGTPRALECGRLRAPKMPGRVTVSCYGGANELEDYDVATEWTDSARSNSLHTWFLF